jgi:hypothetical protein
VCAFEKGALVVAQVKRPLQLGRFARTLRAEEGHGRVGGDDGAGVAAEQVARILRREDQ